MIFRRKFAACLTAAALMSGFCSVTAFAGDEEEVTEYSLWVGSTQVTSANKDDILGDGGKAKYDPETQTLTLDNPTITGYHYDHSYSAQIFADSFALTVTGTANFDYETGNSTLAIWDYKEVLTLKDCDFTTTGFNSAFVSCDYYVTVENSSLRITGIDATGNNSFALAGKQGVRIKDSYIEAERCGRPFSGEQIIIEGASTVVRLTASENSTSGVVVSCDDLQILEPLTVLEPEGAVIEDGTIKDADGKNAMKLVITNEEGYGEVEVQVVGEGTASVEKQFYGYGGIVKINAEPAKCMKIEKIEYLIPDSEPADITGLTEFQMPAADKVIVVVTFAEDHKPVLVEEIPAACEETGVKAHYLCECGKIFEDAEGKIEITDPDTLIIPALGHDWDEGTVTKEPTATEEGEITYVCRNDPDHVRVEKIPALGEESSEEDSSEADSSEPESEEESSSAPSGNNGGTNPNTGAKAAVFAVLAVVFAAVIIIKKRK